MVKLSPVVWEETTRRMDWQTPDGWTDAGWKNVTLAHPYHE